MWVIGPYSVKFQTSITNRFFASRSGRLPVLRWAGCFRITEESTFLLPKMRSDGSSASGALSAGMTARFQQVDVTQTDRRIMHDANDHLRLSSSRNNLTPFWRDSQCCWGDFDGWILPPKRRVLNRVYLLMLTAGRFLIPRWGNSSCQRPLFSGRHPPQSFFVYDAVTQALQRWTCSVPNFSYPTSRRTICTPVALLSGLLINLSPQYLRFLVIYPPRRSIDCSRRGVDLAPEPDKPRTLGTRTAFFGRGTPPQIFRFGE